MPHHHRCCEHLSVLNRIDDFFSPTGSPVDNQPPAAALLDALHQRDRHWSH
jgi:hypothetical protein